MSLEESTFQTNGKPKLLSILTSNSVSYYWADKGLKKVECEIQVLGNTLSVNGIFDVLRPVAKVKTQTSHVTIGLDIHGEVFRVYFGQYRGTNLDAIPGILFSNTLKMPVGDYNYGNTNYSINWVQLLTSHNSSILLSGTNHTFQTSGTVLDTDYPGSDDLVHFDDSPGISLEEDGETSASYNGDFKTWLMFKPANGGWVPLRTVTWYIHCAASLSGTNWVLTAQDWPTNPADADAKTTYPVWTDNVENTNSFNWNPPLP